MGFFSDFKRVRNFIESNSELAELEEYVKLKKQTIDKLNEDLYKLENDIKKFADKKITLKQEIESLSKELSEYQKSIDKYFSLKTRELVKVLVEDRNYEFYKITLEKDVPKSEDFNGVFYLPISIKRVLDLQIQEFAAIENFDFALLRKMLYEVNGAWSETYDAIDDKVSKHLYKNRTTTKILLTFMMLRKKEKNIEFTRNNEKIEAEEMDLINENIDKIFKK